MLNNFLSLVGCICVLSLLLLLIWPMFNYFILRYFICKRNDLKKAGEWVVITGAADGIGRAFAEELAKDGFNIMLIGLVLNDLLDVSKPLEASYNVKTRIFVADFSQENFSYDDMENEINSLSSIACLINNVGICYTYPDDLCTSKFITVPYIQSMITCNVTTITKMLRVVLPKMRSEPLPPPGVHRFVINMGSISGFYTIPYMTVYSACKAYIRSLSEGLAVELRDTCVKVQLFGPSLVATKMSGLTSPTTMIPSAATFAKSALSMLGVEGMCSGYFYHAMQLQIMRLIPTNHVNRWLTKRMLRSRHTCMQKLQAKAD